MARFLQGVDSTRPPVTIVDAGARKPLELRVEVPVKDMSRLGQPLELPSGPASQPPPRASIWTAIHPRLLELIQAHRTTLVFVNSRRVADPSFGNRSGINNARAYNRCIVDLGYGRYEYCN